MMADPAASSLEAELGRIGALLEQRRFAESLAAAKTLAQQMPDSRDALLAIAVSQRSLQQNTEALATLARLEHAHPNFSRLHQERGHCHVALKDAVPAIDAYLRAVNLNPALPASWNALESLFRMTGQADNERMAAAHGAALKRLPPEVVTASSLFTDGDLAAAERIIRAFRAQHGDHVEALRLLGRIALQRAALNDAKALFERVLELAPEYRAARFDYASALVELQMFLEARGELAKLTALDPGNLLYRSLHATASAGFGAHEEAVSVYRELIAAGAAPPIVHVSLANALKTLGRSEEAVAAYRAAARLRPDFGNAYWSLANLKTYIFSDEEVAHMRSSASAPATRLVDRYHLCFALGKALEDRGEYADSYTWYERGNALKRSEITYRPEPERHARRQIEVCTEELFANRKGSGSPDRSPIFIVGLPRSGSTLLEQILASHSRVEGTRELTEIPRLIMELLGRDADMANPRYPRILSELTGADFLRLGEQYLAETSVYRSGKPHFIDKLPGNFRHVGLIHLILPRAKIIDARREPMACCFSNFKQLFAGGQEFTYSLDDLARYYRAYLELMRHWDGVLPGQVLCVHHEDVVADLEGSVRRMLDFCALEFEPQCLEFYKTERSVRTASSEQVRQPIFRDGLDQWRHFEPMLGSLKAALGDALTKYRDEARI
jgi:tetratricopeptide (TPR) repeat protein